jgi:hypothetical protein
MCRHTRLNDDIKLTFPSSFRNTLCAKPPLTSPLTVSQLVCEFAAARAMNSPYASKSADFRESRRDGARVAAPLELLQQEISSALAVDLGPAFETC